MRAILDTNIYVSYLLSGKSLGAAATELVEVAFRGDFDLLIPQEQISEL